MVLKIKINYIIKSRQEQKPDIWVQSEPGEAQSKRSENFFQPQKNKKFFQTTIKEKFTYNAFLCDRKFRKLQKVADPILEMQIYTSTQKVKNL